jgi:hypothetical protein
MNTPSKQQLLQQIAAIPAMERGKLSVYSFKKRSGHSGPYYKLQSWQGGKNLPWYVPSDELAALQAVLDGCAHYQQLTQQYAALVIAETRQSITASKKEIPRHTFVHPYMQRGVLGYNWMNGSGNPFAFFAFGGWRGVSGSWSSKRPVLPSLVFPVLELDYPHETGYPSLYPQLWDILGRSIGDAPLGGCWVQLTTTMGFHNFPPGAETGDSD